MKLSMHAINQINTRGESTGLFTVDDVTAACHAAESGIKKFTDSQEVRVIVKTVCGSVRLQDGSFGVYLPDGSNGQLVVACMDPRTLTVKTVMLQRERQARGHSKSVPYITS